MSNITRFDSQQQDLETLKTMASIAVRSGKYQGYDESTILNIFFTARALNIDPMLALNGGFSIVQGKINMGAHFMAALVRRAGHSMKITVLTSDKCVIFATRKDNSDSLTYEMTMQEAQMAGLTGKANWQKHPKQMLYSACVRNIFRMLFSDIAIPYDADEMNVDDSAQFGDRFDSIPSLVLPDKIDKIIDPVPYKAPLDGIAAKTHLIEELTKDGICADRLDEWIQLRCQLKNQPEQVVIELCLKVLESFKRSFNQWLKPDSESLAV